MNVKLVRDQLKRKKLTQIELAEMAGISKAQISNILTGRSKQPKIETIEKIAAVLGLQVSLLLAPENLTIQNGNVNIGRDSKGKIVHAPENQSMYTTTAEIDSMKKEIDNLREIIRSKDETIASLKMTIEAIMRN